jgi:hypothetical protein
MRFDMCAVERHLLGRLRWPRHRLEDLLPNSARAPAVEAMAAKGLSPDLREQQYREEAGGTSVLARILSIWRKMTVAFLLGLARSCANSLWHHAPKWAPMTRLAREIVAERRMRLDSRGTV